MTIPLGQELTPRNRLVVPVSIMPKDITYSKGKPFTLLIVEKSYNK
ncbi:MAG: hypothetical protein QXI80_08155 [Ignisphaera sp.]